jgi:hypothetical protein
MADLTITGLSAQASATNDDLLAIVDSPGSSPVTNKITKGNLLKGAVPESRVVLDTTASVVGVGMTNISGMSLSVSAGGVYRLNAQLILNRNNAAILYGYGLTFPAMTNCRGTYYVGTSSTQSALGTASVAGGRVIFDGGSSGATLISTISTARLSTYARIEAIMVPSADGTIQLQAMTSNASNALAVVAGSYMEVVRLS